MSSRIIEAVFKKDGIEKRVGISDMADGNYKNIYNGYLFCPEPNCNAQLRFVSGNKRIYFRTKKVRIIDGKIIDEHIKLCPNSVEHDAQIRATRRRDSKLSINLTAEHMKRVLHNAYNNQFEPEKNKKKIKPHMRTTKRPIAVNKIDDSLKPIGKIGTDVDTTLNRSKKQPSIFSKSINDISERDYLDVQCVYGSVKEMILSGPYPYITLQTKDNKKARILFSEAFGVNNPAILKNIQIYKEYSDIIKHGGLDPFVCCIGEITKDDYDISVVFGDHRALQINKKGYYDIVNLIMDPIIA